MTLYYSNHSRTHVLPVIKLLDFSFVLVLRKGQDERTVNYIHVVFWLGDFGLKNENKLKHFMTKVCVLFCGGRYYSNWFSCIVLPLFPTLVLYVPLLPTLVLYVPLFPTLVLYVRCIIIYTNTQPKIKNTISSSFMFNIQLIVYNYNYMYLSIPEYRNRT